MANIQYKIESGVESNSKMNNFDIKEISQEFNKLMEAAEFLSGKNEAVTLRTNSQNSKINNNNSTQLNKSRPQNIDDNQN